MWSNSHTTSLQNLNSLRSPRKDPDALRGDPNKVKAPEAEMPKVAKLKET
jgi:hypothetical protein